MTAAVRLAEGGDAADRAATQLDEDSPKSGRIRQALLAARLRASGLTQVAVWVPSDRKADAYAAARLIRLEAGILLPTDEPSEEVCDDWAIEASDHDRPAVRVTDGHRPAISEGCAAASPFAWRGDKSLVSAADASLDPVDWSELRALGHRMLDDVFDDLAGIRDAPVWRPMPNEVRAGWDDPLPRSGVSLDVVYRAYRWMIAPYGVGNRHPRFLGWVHGGGTAVGMLSEMLASGLNANCGGRDHAPIDCERQVVRWAAELLGLPPGSSGLVVTGTSMANLIAVLVARSAAGTGIREAGVGGHRLRAYASAGAHLCVGRALDMAGLGSDALATIPCDGGGAMDVAALAAAIVEDAAGGKQPFLVVGTAGSVDTGAIDDLTAIAGVCAAHGVWFHVDAAFGAIAMLSPVLRPLFAGTERADSVAFDFHKWAQVPYDAGCIVVRDAAAHRAAFARPAAYLRREAHGLAAGEPWPVDLGPELSRGFRALKVWMTLKVYGADRLGAVAEHCCRLARQLAATIDAAPDLERTAPVALNVVCFRYRPGDDAMQAAIAAELQQAGDVVLSTTTLEGRLVLRAAFVNHRTVADDVAHVVAAIVAAGMRRRRSAGSGQVDRRVM